MKKVCYNQKKILGADVRVKLLQPGNTEEILSLRFAALGVVLFSASQLAWCRFGYKYQEFT